MIPSKAMRDEWRRLATETQMTSAKEFTVLLDAVDELEQATIALAKLAAKGPCFFNPLKAFEAEVIRDRILAQHNLNPDGSFISAASAETTQFFNARHDARVAAGNQSLASWRDNPDRSGGQYTQDEINNSTRWR